MNSGKSTALLQAAYNYEERDQSVVLAKPRIDTKGDQTIVSRLGVTRAVDFTIDETDDVYTRFQAHQASLLRVRQRDVACLLVDEAQFLTRDQVWQLARVADQLGVPVLAYGLRTDFRGDLFEGSSALLAIADSLREIRTICECGRKATMVIRLGPDGETLTEGEQVSIAKATYVSVCRRHWEERMGRFPPASASGG